MRWPFYAGLVAPTGPAGNQDLHALSRTRSALVRLHVTDNGADDLLLWRSRGAAEFILQLISPLPGQTPTSPQVFVDALSGPLTPFIAHGVRMLELQEMPNRPERGLGASWADGAAFGIWFRETATLLRTRFGAGVRIGFPALDERIPEWPAFFNAAVAALQEADWTALHCYWTSRDEMRSYDGPLRFLRNYLENAPDQTFYVTEFANLDPATASQARGEQYAEFLTLLAQYDPMGGACVFPWRSTDPQWEPLGCLAGDGSPRAALDALAARPRLVDPFALPMIWPSEFRAYNQYFGENQAWYQQTSRMVAGHNGVDLRVHHAAPQHSPIRAALSGTVTQVALDETGYGHHLRVQSYAPGPAEVTLLYAHLSEIHVAQGMVVQAGDVLGMAGSTGMSTGPHLHLGMKIGTIPLPTTNGWLNPRPYLDCPVRGAPRVPYARTYVLLPPAAGAEWAAAVVRSSWEARRFTVGGSADDAGIGDLDYRRVLAVNPGGWNGDLAAFFNTWYPGVGYEPLEIATPAELEARLSALSDWPPAGTELPVSTGGRRGQPREPYERTYVLLPPDAGADWAAAVIAADWEHQRFTLGGSADDAGIGALPLRRVLAVNPGAWGADLPPFFEEHYPGVVYVPLFAATPEALQAQLLLFSRS